MVDSTDGRAQLTIRCTTDLDARIKRYAKEERRSVNQSTIDLLEIALTVRDIERARRQEHLTNLVSTMNELNEEN